MHYTKLRLQRWIRRGPDPRGIHSLVYKTSMWADRERYDKLFCEDKAFTRNMVFEKSLENR